MGVVANPEIGAEAATEATSSTAESFVDGLFFNAGVPTGVFFGLIIGGTVALVAIVVFITWLCMRTPRERRRLVSRPLESPVPRTPFSALAKELEMNLMISPHRRLPAVHQPIPPMISSTSMLDQPSPVQITSFGWYLIFICAVQLGVHIYRRCKARRSQPGHAGVHDTSRSSK